MRSALFLIFLSCAAAWAQPPGDRASLPTVVFHFEGHAQPFSYELSVQRDGSLHYAYTEKSVEVDAEPFRETRDLFLTQSTLLRIFDLARQARFFAGDFDYHEHRIADTGAKTLTYVDGAEKTSTTYNWSQNQSIDQLTRIFQGMAATLEAGRRLESMRKYDKLGLNAELSALEQRVNGRSAQEVYLIEPILRLIAADSSLMQVSRNRAERLLLAVEQSKAELVK